VGIAHRSRPYLSRVWNLFQYRRQSLAGTSTAGARQVQGTERNPMTMWVLHTLNGISLGMLLFLLAAGLSLIYGLM
jgi:hypothetical protein